MFDQTLDRPTLCADLMSASRRTYGALRYGVVLLVWLGLMMVRPALAIAVFKTRRADSPIPRMGLARRPRRALGLWREPVL